MLLISVALLIATVIGEATNTHYYLSDEFIDLINSQQTTWTAGRNFPEAPTMEHFRRLLGTSDDEPDIKLPIRKHNDTAIAQLPESFDLRDQWPKCSSLTEIRDQGACGGCWAVAAASAMTDRVCINSGGAQQFHFSAQDLLSCNYNSSGCDSGDASTAWKFWEEEGIVSGGNYNSKEGCRPYELEPCAHVPEDPGKPCKGPAVTNACYDKCTMPNIDYRKDKRYGKSSYQIYLDEEHVKAELYHHGPVQATFLIYSDFAHYKKGVYKHTAGTSQGAHSVKLMGWGVENGTKYWLVANSWSATWGDKGYFKIIRGCDECKIEKYIVAGEPLL